MVKGSRLSFLFRGCVPAASPGSRGHKNVGTCGCDAQSGVRPGDIALAVIVPSGAAGYTQQTPTPTG